MGIRNRALLNRHEGRIEVSVPLRGNGYKEPRSGELPSTDWVFPSPCGEMGIRNENANYNEIPDDLQVSVPLRGNGYKEHKYNERETVDKEEKLMSFRPLAGKWV